MDELLNGINPFNAKGRANQINKLLDSYIPAVEKMQTQLKKYKGAFTTTMSENSQLKQKNKQLSQELKDSQS